MRYELEARPFFQILHALLRHDEDLESVNQTAAVMEWVATRRERMQRVCSRAEWLVIQTVYQYWYRNQSAPSRKVMDDLLHAQQQPAEGLEILREYDKFEDDLEVLAVGDLDAPLDARVADWEKWRLTNTLGIANQIAVGSWQSPKDKNAPVLTGPRDSMNFVIGKFQEGILVNDVPAVGGELTKTADDIYARYKSLEADKKANKLFIPTGIAALDNHLGGLRRKELNGVLAFTGQRKTYTCRTVAYNAAANKHRVLHIPLESGYHEEETIYTVFHAGTLKNRPYNITKTKLDRADLTKEEKEWYRDVVIPDYAGKIAPNIVVHEPKSRSWAEVKSIIERENFKQEIDLVIIDYLTMLRTPGASDDAADKMRIIQDVKMMAMTLNHGEGVSILTPIQGNRVGFNEAGNNEGRWDLTGIHRYSEIEKSLDNCFYVWFNESLNHASMVKMGTCKSRRHALIPPTSVEVDHTSGLIGRRIDP